jgi:hypothetical protein
MIGHDRRVARIWGGSPFQKRRFRILAVKVFAGRKFLGQPEARYHRQRSWANWFYEQTQRPSPFPRFDIPGMGKSLPYVRPLGETK